MESVSMPASVPSPHPNRREADSKLAEIDKQLKSNTLDIATISSKLNKLAASVETLSVDQETRLTALEEPVAIITELISDVAVVGKVGKFIKSIVVWAGIVGGAFYGLFHWLDNITKLK